MSNKKKKCYYCENTAEVADLCDEHAYLQAESELIKEEVTD